MQKIKQMLSNTLRLNFYYLKIIRILHPRYHSKITEHVLRISKRTSVSFFMRLYVNHNENEDTDRIDTTQIDLGLSMDANIMNINSVSV